ncbi:MAG TPA: helix-turn-helix transcriptional regulator [Candidatus Hydrogenedentes bacterium]|nr:helix-turn-helix transcriptional regulator [Candidatus Hydrogenedentota bacterium]HPG70337.1 helix-turn-helix transcriptional regulator [Candidatus Hydrogenedentota bacterium]
MKLRVTKTSGNVFTDLDLPDAEDAIAKAELAWRINAIIRQRGLKQTEAAALLGIDQAKVSALSRGRLNSFSTERLFRFLNALGQDVQIVIRAKPASRDQGQVSVRETTPTTG